jgi:type II secretory pathway component GspD/PulD (secretin)
MTAFAQETPPAAAPAAQASETTPAAEQTPAPPPEAPAPADPAPAAPAPAAPAAAPADDAAAPAAIAAAAPTGEGNPVKDTGVIIPLIVMDDVPLTDAVKNLARQADLNYMLDPKVTFGQTGADGRAVPQPMVSLRWENVTAIQALDALLNNYNLQMVEDPKSKIARVTVKDPAAPDPLVTRVVQLDYASPSNIVAAVQNTLTDKRSKVVADVRTSQLVVLATEKEQVNVETLVERLDTPTKQVLIEARLLETSMNPTTKKGVDWSGTLQNQQVTFGNNLKENTPTESVNNTLADGKNIPKLLFDTAKGFNPSTAFLDADGLSAVISFLNQYSEAKVISSPRTVTLDNEPARIEVVRASPIINVTPGTVQVAGGSQIQYTNLGIILNVTPRISANNKVNLKVVPEVSRVFGTVTKVVADGIYQADEYDIRKMETRVMIPSGNTLVMGGLVQDDVRKGNTKVPVLGDIPWLGGLFRVDSKSRQKSNLMVFVTPTIVQDSDFQPTESTFLKNPVPKSDDLEDDWSAWDSGKPKKEFKKEAKEKEAEVFSEVDPKATASAPVVELTEAK